MSQIEFKAQSFLIIKYTNKFLSLILSSEFIKKHNKILSNSNLKEKEKVFKSKLNKTNIPNFL